MRLRKPVVAACASVLATVPLVLWAITATAAPTRYEAEASPAACDGTIDTNWPGYSGSGFCNGRNAIGAAAQFTVNASMAGTATIWLRFANGTTTDRLADLAVNGSIVQVVSFEGTGTWDNWTTKVLTVAAQAGGNTIQLSPTTAAGLPNIDYLEIDVASQPTRYEAEVSPAACDGTIDTNWPGYSGSGFCNGRNAAGAALQLTVNASTGGATALAIRFANGTTTARPVDVLVNGVLTQSVSFEGTSTWDTWMTKMLSASLNPGSNTVRLNPTAASGLPNVDYFEIGGPNPTPCHPPSPSVSPTSQPSINVWLAGDSTMANPSGGAVCPVGWGNQFAQYFNGKAAVNNSAVGGRSIQTWLYDPNVSNTMNSAGECVINPAVYSNRWQAMLNSVSGMKAGDYLLIQFGINDGSSTCPRHVGSARYKELLSVMATAAKQRGARPIFLTPVAAIRCSGGTAVGNRGFVTETFDAGSANGVSVINLHSLSVALYNSLGLCPNNGDYGSGPVGAFFCNDHTHFEAAGARQIAGVVAKALRDQGIPLADYLK